MSEIMVALDHVRKMVCSYIPSADVVTMHLAAVFAARHKSPIVARWACIRFGLICPVRRGCSWGNPIGVNVIMRMGKSSIWVSAIPSVVLGSMVSLSSVGVTHLHRGFTVASARRKVPSHA